MIRKFILSIGDKLMDVLVVISLILVFIAGIASSSETRSFGEGLLTFLVVELVGIVYVIVVFYFIYLLMDIRYILKKIEENTRKET